MLYSSDYQLSPLVEKYMKTTKTVLGDVNSPSITTSAYTDKNGNLRIQERHRNGAPNYTDTFNYDYLGNRTDEIIARAYDEVNSNLWVKPGVQVNRPI
ncbi:UNVERIFIED_CONTAM: hypothetical protein Cloal_4321 [Acetivibrio alkalicellulosi]